jgi:hypothetical protein
MPRKRRADPQISGLAGEFFVAAELLKRDIQTSVTLGNAKAVDLLAYRVDTGQTFRVQVKSLRENNYFPIGHDEIDSSLVYVFVLLNKPGVPVRYFIVPGSELRDRPEKFGKWFTDYRTFPGIGPRDLAEFENNWAVFGCPGGE